MKRSSSIVWWTVETILLASVAAAGTFHHVHGCGMPSWNLSEIDANSDGILSFEEFSGPHQQRLKAGFDMIDGDKDGLISEDEWSVFLSVHGVETTQ